MNTPSRPSLLETLAAGLERPREVSAQVVNHVLETYGIEREAIGDFLVDQLPLLEDYEVDLILSPLFTPHLQDQAVVADLLGGESIPAAAWPALIQQLVARPTRAQLETCDGQRHLLTLRDVTLERYVHRLRLDGTMPEALARMLSEFPVAADRPILKAIARRAIWENEPRRRILVHYLVSVAQGAKYELGDVIGLLKLAETYQPADLNELRGRIPHWLQMLRQEIDQGGGSSPFFNERVEELHGGGRDQRRPGNSRTAAKEKEREFLERLNLLLADPSPLE